MSSRQEARSSHRCGRINFHLCTSCQPDCGVPQGFVAAAKQVENGRRVVEGGGLTAPLALSPRYRGKREGIRKLWTPHRRPIRAAPPPRLTSSAPRRGPPGRMKGFCISCNPLPLWTCTPTGLLYRRLSARPLLLCLRLRMGPLLSPIHTSPAAEETASTPSPTIATADGNSLLSRSVFSLPLYSVCIPEQSNVVWMNLKTKKQKGHRGLKRPECNRFWIYDDECRGTTGSPALRRQSYLQDPHRNTTTESQRN